MPRKPGRIMALALALAMTCSSTFAQEAAQPKPDEVDTTDYRAQPPTTEANADAVVATAIEAARKPDFNGYDDTDVEQRVTHYPHITLKRLKPYTADPSGGVRTLILSAVRRVLNFYADPPNTDLYSDALSLLLQIVEAPPTETGASASEAIGTLNSSLFAGYREEREAMRQKVDMVALKPVLLSYLERTHDLRALDLLTLYASDASLKPFVDKLAEQEEYSLRSLIGQAAWGDGNAIAAIKEKIQFGQSDDLKELAASIIAINEPNVLRSLWKQLDNKRVIGDYPLFHGPEKVAYVRVCDYVWAAFKLKFDSKGNDIGLVGPSIATDEELAAAKARYHAVIAPMPQIGAQVGNAFEPF